MGDTADQLLIKLLLWLEQKERCAQHLWKLVRELEALRESECVGSSASIIGATCIIGTIFTAGLAALFLGALGTVYVGSGAVISLTSQVIEDFVSGSTVADAQKVAKQSETIEVEIMKLIEKLKMERANTDQDEDKYIAQCFALAMWGKAHTGKPLHCASIFLREAPTLLELLYTFLFRKDVQQLALSLAKAEGKTAVKSATKLLGAVGMVFALTESIDNWKEMVKKKHVTEDSQSLRDSAEKIEQFCKELRNELKIIEYAIFRHAIEKAKCGMWMGLLNVRSMATKAEKILDIIVQNDLDVLLTTETWLTPYNFESVLQDACPRNFTFYHQSGDGRRGGGVGIQHTKLYSCKRIRYSDITTFEYVAVVLKKDEWEVPVLLVNVYFSPDFILEEFKNVISDFEKLLRNINNPTHINGKHDHVIFTGDFNIHKDLGKKFLQFNDLLEKFGMMQYVEKPTHNKGHTLDLVLTRNVDVSNLIVFDPHVSDHYIVIFMSIPVAPNN
ncbi:hypothetical protein NHX12_031782 [Muraenolepis orangiensis]|uniref:Endonuclease/exonuclease/phosphatase domain-containing protein n=1 Tax=Muraenolepis orangiensis TaxID=630683 RepID=A0A9Q0IHM1_9TELE|nr:hypothetical protein NHX12_031782 [Muraenolepis orangiensis]